MNLKANELETTTNQQENINTTTPTSTNNNNTCQLCKLHPIQNSTENNQCSKCDKLICDRCSILSSMMITNKSKICILCKTCSKEDILSSSYTNPDPITNATDNDLCINEQNPTKPTHILAEISNNSETLDMKPKTETKKKRKLPLAPLEPSNFSSTRTLNNQSADLTSISSSLCTLNHNLNDLVLAKPPIINNVPASPTLVKPKLENATEWLKKSFDQSQIQTNTLSPAVNSSKSKSTQELFVPTRQQRSSSDAYLTGLDEPLVEINLNKSFYLKKQQQSLESSSENVKSHSTPQIPAVVDSNQVIEHVYLFNEPEKEEIDEEVFINQNRRPSASLGINISGCQRVPELNEQTLAAVVSSVEPNGVVDKFNVPISEGDEIIEINGHNLRNKNDTQIEKIFGTSCLSSNGELELKVRRRSFKNSNKYAINRSLTMDKRESLQTSDDYSVSSSELRDQVINEMSSISSSQTESSDMVSLPRSGRRSSNKQLQKQYSTSSFNSVISTPHYPDVRLVDMKMNSSNSSTNSSSVCGGRRGNDTDSESIAEGRGFRELSIKRKSAKINTITIINSNNKHKQVTQCHRPSLTSIVQNEGESIENQRTLSATSVNDNLNRVRKSSLVTPTTPPTPASNYQPFSSHYLNIGSPRQKLSLIEEHSLNMSQRQSSQDSTKSSSVPKATNNFLRQVFFF